MKFVPIPGTHILMCTTETRVAEFQAAGFTYNPPWYPQGGNHPAVNIQWSEAKNWCAWLSKKEGRTYRLPTEQEWNAATGPFSYTWGDNWPPAYKAGNFAGQEWRTAPAVDLQQMKELWKSKVGGQWSLIKDYHDYQLYTAEVSSGQVDGLGLHHLSGNVWEWCESQVLKGGSWVDGDREVLKSRYAASRPLYDFDNGFRCVLVK
ncbi:formylglycine-generating enzyme family protein [Prosthecobacter fusiformis]|nr:SUMF1/EgtB/PvdO family nonheme iron enzyme [Prosthecobacter fusiformis]